eukprot:jgi/Mesen1/10162/ME000076S09671
MAPTLTMDEVAKLLNLLPHPEGGFYSENFRDTSVQLTTDQLPPQYKVGRPVSTAIYFLIPAGSVSHLHRMPAAEVWHFYSGDPLTVVEIDESGTVKRTVLGQDLAGGQKLQHTVPPGVWFGSFPTLDVGEGGAKNPPRDPQRNYSLVGCTVAPAFEFADFELAKRGKLLEQFPHAKVEIELLAEE